MNINLEYYRVFCQVARFSSISLAAEQLHISQPAVSRTIKQLEQALGTALLVRTSRGVVLTPEGELLYGYVREGMERIAAGEQSLENTLELEGGLLRLGATEMTFHYFLLPFLDDFHRRHPGVHMQVMNSTIPETVRALHDGRIDVGLVITPPHMEQRLNERPIRTIQDIFIAGPAFSQLKGRRVPLSELVEYPIIGHETGTASRAFLDSFFASQGLLFEPAFTLATSDLISPFAEREFGVGVVMKEFAQPALEAGRLFEVKTDPPLPPRTICLVTARDRLLPKAARSFIELLESGEKTLQDSL